MDFVKCVAYYRVLRNYTESFRLWIWHIFPARKNTIACSRARSSGGSKFTISFHRIQLIKSIDRFGSWDLFTTFSTLWSRFHVKFTWFPIEIGHVNVLRSVFSSALHYRNKNKHNCLLVSSICRWSDSNHVISNGLH